MVATEEALDAQRTEVAERMGISLGTFRAKWADIRLSRFEPGWSQSANAFAENILKCSLTMHRLAPSIDDSEVAAALAQGETLTGANQEFVVALLAPVKFAEEFAGYWGGKLGMRVKLAKELGEDVGELVGVIGDAGKELAALTPRDDIEPPRPDLPQ